MKSLFKNKQNLDGKWLYRTLLIGFILVPTIIIFDMGQEKIITTARKIYYGKLYIKEHLKIQLHKFRNDVALLFDSNPSSLPVADLFIAPADLRRIEVITKQLGEKGVLRSSAKRWLPATFVKDNTSYSAKVRIRGDQAVHWLNKKKSWRIKFQKDHLFEGRRSLNLIISKDKYLEIEQAAYLIARQLGLLVPDSGFMLVKQNSRNMGLYFWIEQWDKNQLERRQLPDGEIFGLDDVFMDKMQPAGLPKGPETFYPASYKTFIHKNDGITGFAAERWKRFLELLATKDSILINDEIENYLEVNKFAKWLSMVYLFGNSHAQSQDNLKWFFNTMTGKFEPILYDVALAGEGLLDLPLYNPIVNSILLSEKVIIKRNESLYDIVFNKSEAILDIIKSVSEVTDKYIYMGIESVGIDLPGVGVTSLEDLYFTSENRLNMVKKNISELKKSITNQRVFISSSQKVQKDSTQIEMEILPQGVSPFVLKSLSLKPISKFDQNIKDVEFMLISSSGQKVKIIPKKSELTQDEWAFGFSNLELRTGWSGNLVKDDSKKWVLAAYANGLSTRSSALPATLSMVFSNGLTGEFIPSDLVRTSIIATKYSPETDFIEKEISNELPGEIEDRITSVSLNKEIASFVDQIQITVQLDGYRIIIPKGEYEIRNNIVIPKNYSLVVEAGTHLMFGPNVSMLSYNAIQMKGTLLEPVVIDRLNPKSAWGVIGIISAKEKSVLKFVKISGGGAGTKKIINGIYFTGQLSFHYSDVELVNCEILNSEGEDGLNVKKGNIVVTDSLFLNNKSDALDGDWVSGKISRSHFLNNGNDGIDISGSRMVIVDTVFSGMGDKAVSIGEQSQADLLNNRIQNSTYGIVIKDLSRVRIYSTVIQKNQYGIGAYRKKPLFGGGSVKVIGGLLLGNKYDFMTDQFSNISLNGVGLSQTPKLKRIMVSDQRLGKLTEWFKNDQNDNPIPTSDSKLPIEFQRGPMTNGVLLDGTRTI